MLCKEALCLFQSGRGLYDTACVDVLHSSSSDESLSALFYLTVCLIETGVVLPFGLATQTDGGTAPQRTVLIRRRELDRRCP